MSATISVNVQYDNDKKKVSQSMLNTVIIIISCTIEWSVVSVAMFAVITLYYLTAVNCFLFFFPRVLRSLFLSMSSLLKWIISRVSVTTML